MSKEWEEDKFTKARLDLIKLHPFWGQLAMFLKPREKPDLNPPTTAVDLAGHFYYHPEHVEKLNNEDLMFEIAHELGHLFTKTLERFPPGGIHPIYNKASDIVIDTLLKDSGLNQSWISKECTTEETMKKYADQHTLEVYHDLIKNTQKCSGNCGEGEGHVCICVATNDPRQCTGVTGKGCSKKDAELLTEWKQRAVAAAHAVKDRGRLPGILAELIQEILNPKVRWTDFLRVKTQQTMKRKWTWRVPSRRGEAMNLTLPGKHPKLPTAVIAADTSGSISDKELQRFISEASEILRLTGGKIRVILFDSEVYFDEEVQDFRMDVTKFQRGGTDFNVVMEHLEDTEKPNLLVFFTDLYAPYPEDPPGYPVVWGLTPNHNSDPVPFGETVVVDDD